MDNEMKSQTKNNTQEVLLRIWQHIFKFDWRFGVFLVLLFGIPRFILVLDANVSGNYGTAFIIFFLMWFAPLLFLTKKGRREIGMWRPNRYIHLLGSFVTGALSCAAIFGMFVLFYGKGEGNAFVYMARATAQIGGTIPESERLTYFLIAAIPSMIFSPIGEEFLFRGVVHGSFVGQFGESGASFFDSGAFALTHLAHFGIVYSAGNWSFLPIPALLWVLAMFFVSQVFFRCKLMCNSIFGAVLSHSGFNFAMMYFIFYHILP
ncbi:MAG: CPBP family intramembrane metalloprotease [Mediterranea sp.]|jgi:membrane protease YdiL (CAAX protease family)|nr:CPBP family intramembrane metalloprotease [Mediterranea sp.]